MQCLAIKEGDNGMRAAIRTLSSRPGCGEPEKLFRSSGRLARESFQGDASLIRDPFGDETGMGRLAAFAPMGHGSKIGTIRFHHVTILRNRYRGLANKLRVLERHNSSE